MHDEKYYAFISYSRRDFAKASILHKRLEAFKYPQGLSPDRRPPDRKFVRNIFIDRRNLECTDESFHEGLKEALRTSRYLIVLCSSNSAKPNTDGSHYVNDEIQYFLKTHDNDVSLIVPVLLDGKIENLPPAINTRVFIDRNNPNWGDGEGEQDEVIAHILNYLLGVDITKIRARLNSQRIAVMRWGMLAGLVLAAIFSAVAVTMVKLKRDADSQRKIAEDRKTRIEAQIVEINSKSEEILRQKSCAEENALRAEHQREIAEEALDFMLETFNMADPTHLGRNDATVADVLKNRVDDIGKLEPWDLRASVSTSIGSLLDNIGDRTDASNLLFAAVSIYEKNNPSSSDFANALYCLGWWYARNRDNVAAYNIANRALKVAEKTDCTDKLKAKIYNALGVYSQNYGKNMYDTASSYYVKALEASNADNDESLLLHAVISINQGYLLRSMKKYNESIASFEHAIQTINSRFGEEHVNVAKALRGVGMVKYDLGDYDGAIEAYEKGLKILKQTVGTKSIYVVEFLRLLGRAYLKVERREDAKHVFSEGFKLAKEFLGPKDSLTIEFERNLHRLANGK